MSDTTTSTTETEIAKIVLEAGRAVSEVRLESLRKAIKLGATHEVLVMLATALRVGRKETVFLPAGRHEHLSRGSGWCRKGRGSDAVWGAREAPGYRCGPGRWIVGSSDGFHRNAEETYTARHVQVGGETWTIAN